MKSVFDLEHNIARWKSTLQSTGNLNVDDIGELEVHLRDEIDHLAAAGLSKDESFLIGIRRLGSTSEIASEYFKVNGGRLWKQLEIPGMGGGTSFSAAKEIVLAVFLSLAAGLASQIPYLFGLSYVGEDPISAARFLPVLLYPFLAGFMLWKRRLNLRYALSTLAALVAGLLIILLYPFAPGGDTIFLTTIHLFMCYWLLFGLLYASFGDRVARTYADFLKFTGELFIYTVLIYLGGGVLLGIAGAIFTSMEIDPMPFIQRHLFVAGGFAAPVLATYFVEAKRSVIENIAPVLARIFIPLFFLAIVSIILAIAVTRTNPFADRELLIIVDVLLVFVLAMVFYSISARREEAEAGFIEWCHIALILAASALDIIALAAIVFRLASFGPSANKVAALGANVLMLGHLAAMAEGYFRFLRGKTGFDSIERRLVSYLPVYGVWFAVVALLFPVLFRFI